MVYIDTAVLNGLCIYAAVDLLFVASRSVFVRSKAGPLQRVPI